MDCTYKQTENELAVVSFIFTSSMQVFADVGTCAAHLEVAKTIEVGYCRASGNMPLVHALFDRSTVLALNGNRVPFCTCLGVCSRGRRSPDTRMFFAPAFAVTVGDLYEGYQRYGSPRAPFLWCHNTTKWRSELAEALSVDLATCFWRAMAFIATKAETLALWGQAALATPAGVMDGVSVAQAFLHFNAAPLVNPAGPIYSLYFLNPVTGALNAVVQGQKIAGLAYVCLDDNGEYKPHWLPVTNYVLANASPPTTADILVGLPAMVAAGVLPALAAPFAALQANFHALNPLPPPPPPPLLPPVPVIPPVPIGPVNRRPPVVYMPPDCDGFVCFRDPPIQDLGVVLAPGQVVDPTAAMFSKKLWVHTPTTAVGSLRLMDGKGPDALDRALAHATGCGFCFEFRPETLIGQEICERDFCFAEDSSPATRSHGLNLLGQYHVRFVSVVVTDGGTWRLRLVGQSAGVHGRYVNWYKFCKSGHSSMFAMLCDCLPLHTECITSIQFSTPLYVEPVCSDFPTADAWYRAMYQFLAQTVPPEVVAPLMTARNEEMSLQARSGKHPREVADALVLLWRQLQSELGSARAFALK